MFESGVLPHDPADGAAGGVSAPAEEPVAPLPTEDAADLLAPLGAGGALAGVVEGLLARLLVPVRSDGEDAGSAVDAADLAGKAGTAESEGLFSGEPGGDAALAAVAEVRRVASVEEAASSGLMALGAAGLAELAAACHRLVAWASWGEALAPSCRRIRVSGARTVGSRRWWGLRSGGSTPPACCRPAWGYPGVGLVRSWITAAR